MTELQRVACGPCQADQCHQCRGGEWDCPCNHLRHLSRVSDAASTDPVNRLRPPVADETGSADGVSARGSAATPPPPAEESIATLRSADAGGTFSPAPGPEAAPRSSGPGATFPRPDWWGEHGCRRADDLAHTCLDVDGRPPEHGRPCATECRAAMADLFATYKVRGPITVGAEQVAVLLVERLAPMSKAAGQ